MKLLCTVGGLNPYIEFGMSGLYRTFTIMMKLFSLLPNFLIKCIGNTGID